jgi:Zinc-binding dehydrogenase
MRITPIVRIEIRTRLARRGCPPRRPDADHALVDRAHVKPGQKVLVHAGSGGLGSTVIQLAKHFGAAVATTARGKNAELVRPLGADVVIDYKKQDFAEVLSGYDVVLDSRGGENLEKSLTVLKSGGQAIGVTGPPDPGFAKQLGAPKFMGVVMDGAGQPLVPTDFPDEWAQFAIAMRSAGLPPGPCFVPLCIRQPERTGRPCDGLAMVLISCKPPFQGPPAPPVRHAPRATTGDKRPLSRHFPPRSGDGIEPSKRRAAPPCRF